MLSKGVPVPLFFMQRNGDGNSLFVLQKQNTRKPGVRRIFSMLQYRLSVVSNITVMKTFGKPAMFICDADKFSPATIGTDRDNEAWNRPFRQSLYIPIRS